MKLRTPRIPFWLPIVGAFVSVGAVIWQAHFDVGRLFTDLALENAKQDSMLIEKVLTADTPNQVAEPYIKKRLIDDAILDLGNNTAFLVRHLEPDGSWKIITEKYATVNSVVNKDTMRKAMSFFDQDDLISEDQARTNGLQFEYQNRRYDIRVANFPMSLNEDKRKSQVISLSSIDAAVEDSNVTINNLLVEIFLVLIVWKLLAFLTTIQPVMVLTKLVKSGKGLALPRWVPIQLDELASQITFERQNLQESVQKAEKLGEEITAVNHIAVHDIKADLTALNKGSEVIQETIAELIEYIKDSTDEVLLDAIEAIKFFSDLNINSARNAFDVLDQRNKLYDLESTIVIADCSVTSLLEAIDASFSSEEGELIIKDTCPEGQQLKADYSLLLAVLKNIVRNGFVHNESSFKKINIIASPTPAGVRVKITDNGVGMPPEYLAVWGKTMGKSAQLDANRGGSGVGLYSIRSIIDAHKNATIVISSTLTKGTTFTLEFNHV